MDRQNTTVQHVGVSDEQLRVLSHLAAQAHRGVAVIHLHNNQLMLRRLASRSVPGMTKRLLYMIGHCCFFGTNGTMWRFREGQGDPRQCEEPSPRTRPSEAAALLSVDLGRGPGGTGEEQECASQSLHQRFSNSTVSRSSNYSNSGSSNSSSN